MFINFLLMFLFLFISTYYLLKLFISSAPKFGLVDIPNHRSSHSTPIVRGAGFVFGLIFLIGICIFSYLSSHTLSYSYILIALILVYLTGVYDDINDIHSKLKFLSIIIAAVIAYYDGFAIVSLGTYFGIELTLGYLSLPFTIFAIVGFTNALNLTDGLDGLAGSISIVILLGLFYIGFIHNDNILTYLSFSLIVPLFAFLIFNWHPAKVFMGDSGSLFLGFTLAILCIYALKYINPVSILFLAAIPLLDTLIVMLRRKQRKQSFFVADKNHLHHILFNFKKDHLFTVKSLLKIQIVFVLIFIQVYDKPDIINLILFGVLFTIFFKLFDPRKQYRNKKKTTLED